MAHQSPMISIPKKTTDDVDWTTPIRSLIQQSYGESPDNYTSECQALQRCRQDAVRGAGSDTTARDLLYKYFGQLELLELRFSEIRVTFPWHDAFTGKVTTQTSIAFEKASVLFQIASTHSAIAAAQNRCDPEGLKRAFHYFKACAGMLTYINENFLHAPSTDLSREVVKFLVTVILAQATEVFFEKCSDEKKGSTLVSKVGAQATSMYTSLVEEVKEFQGKGIFDRNWVTLLQIKAKHFSSLSQYYRGLADSSSGLHGEALVRFTLAETLSKEAVRAASGFSSTFVTNLSPNLPADSAPSILDRVKSHAATCTERRAEMARENDLIYNAVLPAVEALPAIDKLVVAKPIPIQEIYSAPDVQKVIGPDIFIRLVPLSVHESASVYSEEKAKLVRVEVEKSETAEVELRSALEALALKDGINRFKAMAENSVSASQEVPQDVQKWRDDITVMEEQESVDTLMAELYRLRDSVSRELNSIESDLNAESLACEAMRVKYDMLWTQEPSSGPAKSLRQDLKAHNMARSSAMTSDNQVAALWTTVRTDIHILLSPEIEAIFAASAQHGVDGNENLLDLDNDSDANDDLERVKIAKYVSDIEDRLGRLNKISHERGEVLKDLKNKVQTDDVSHLLLLNRRNAGVEPALFTAELEKFRPYQQRLAAAVQYQQGTLQEVKDLWKFLKDHAGRGSGAKKWNEREKRKQDTIRRFCRVRDGYMEVRDGIAKGLQFYRELTELGTELRHSTNAYLSDRNKERDQLVGHVEVKQRLSSSPPRLPPPPQNVAGLNNGFNSMNISGPLRPPPIPPLPPHQWQQTQSSYLTQPRSSPPNTMVGQYSTPSSYAMLPQRTPSLPYASHTSPTPSAPPGDPYASLGNMFGPKTNNINLPHPPPPPPSIGYSYNAHQQPSNQSAQPRQQYEGFPPPPPRPHYQSDTHGYNR